MHVTMCVLQQNNVQFHTLVASVPCTQQIMIQLVIKGNKINIKVISVPSTLLKHEYPVL